MNEIRLGCTMRVVRTACTSLPSFSLLCPRRRCFAGRTSAQLVQLCHLVHLDARALEVRSSPPWPPAVATSTKPRGRRARTGGRGHHADVDASGAICSRARSRGAPSSPQFSSGPRSNRLPMGCSTWPSRMTQGSVAIAGMGSRNAVPGRMMPEKIELVGRIAGGVETIALRPWHRSTTIRPAGRAGSGGPLVFAPLAVAAAEDLVDFYVLRRRPVDSLLRGRALSVNRAGPIRDHWRKYFVAIASTIRAMSSRAPDGRCNGALTTSRATIGG